MSLCQLIVFYDKINFNNQSIIDMKRNQILVVLWLTLSTTHQKQNLNHKYCYLLMSRPPVANTSQYRHLIETEWFDTSWPCKTYNFPVSLDDLNCTTHRPTDSYVSISANGMEGQFLSIVYAEMWRCPNGDNSVIQCPSGRWVINKPTIRLQSIYKLIFLELRMRIGNEFGCKNITQLLPNVFALVRFW